MIYRDLDPRDKNDLNLADEITGRNASGDVRLSQDYITVAASPVGEIGAGPCGRFHALSAGRPVFFVHEFLVRPGLGSRNIAENLLQYSLGKLTTLGERQIHFLVAEDNTAFQEFIRKHGGWQQHIGQIWSMNIPVCHYPPGGRR